MSTTLRTRRDDARHLGDVIATMTITMLALVSAISAMASRIAGNRHHPVHDAHDDRVEPRQ